MADVFLDLFNTYKINIIILSIILLLMAIVNALIQFQKLGDGDYNKKPIYETHFFNIIEDIIQLVICSLGIFAAISEDFRRVLYFGICISALLLVQIVVLCLHFSSSSLVTVLIVIGLVAMAWLYLHEIALKLKLPSDASDERSIKTLAIFSKKTFKLSFIL